MRKESRIDRILNFVKEKKVCSVEELQSTFAVSLSTMHRDLNILLEQGKINKYYGKITLKEQKDLIKNRIIKNIELKKEIAKKALSYIRDDECIFLDNSTTVYYLAELICKSDFKNLLVVSNSAIIHDFFMDNRHIDFISTGGKLNTDFNSYIGPQALQATDSFNGTKYFFSSTCVSINEGVSDVYVPDEIAVKLKMLEKSQESFLLIDSTKIGKVATTQWFKLKDIDHIITDSRIESALMKNFSNVDFPLIIS